MLNSLSSSFKFMSFLTNYYCHGKLTQNACFCKLILYVVYHFQITDYILISFLSCNFQDIVLYIHTGITQYRNCHRYTGWPHSTQCKKCPVTKHVWTCSRTEQTTIVRLCWEVGDIRSDRRNIFSIQHWSCKLCMKHHCWHTNQEKVKHNKTLQTRDMF